MEFLSISEVKKLTNKYFERIPEHNNINFYIKFEPTSIDCIPFIEIGNDGYHIKCYERGKLFQDKITTDVDELLYWLLSDITFSAAVEYEVRIE